MLILDVCKKHAMSTRCSKKKTTKNPISFDLRETFLIDPETTLNYLQFKTKPSSLALFVWKWDKKTYERSLLSQ